MKRKIVLREDWAKNGLWISKRELQIVKLIAEGKTNKTIALELGITLKTVETHRQHVLERLQCSNMPNVVHVLHKEKLLK